MTVLDSKIAQAGWLSSVLCDAQRSTLANSPSALVRITYCTEVIGQKELHLEISIWVFVIENVVAKILLRRCGGKSKCVSQISCCSANFTPFSHKRYFQSPFIATFAAIPIFTATCCPIRSKDAHCVSRWSNCLFFFWETLVSRAAK
jgi:hypothetical protein